MRYARCPSPRTGRLSRSTPLDWFCLGRSSDNALRAPLPILLASEPCELAGHGSMVDADTETVSSAATNVVTKKVDSNDFRNRRRDKSPRRCRAQVIMIVDGMK